MEPLRLELPPFPTTSFWTLDRRKLYCTLPAEGYEITPSSDLWIADSTCADNCNEIDTFNPSQSSSFINSTTPFAIKYGSGSAQGFLGKDVVQLGGFSVSNQVFGKSLTPLPQQTALRSEPSSSV